MQGLEIMLRNMGLASVLDAAKQLAESGAVHKIIKFADQMEGLQSDIAEIKAGRTTCPNCGHCAGGIRPDGAPAQLPAPGAEPSTDPGAERLSA